MYCDKLAIRATAKKDDAAIAGVIAEAFGRKDEANLALDLIHSAVRTFSLIGECEGRAVGHVLLSEIGAPIHSLALAPLGVIPDARELQVGSRLVQVAIERGRRAGYDAIFVLGDPGYYERFGFNAALARPFKAPWSGPYLMALGLKGGEFARKSGKLTYPDRFFR